MRFPGGGALRHNRRTMDRKIIARNRECLGAVDRWITGDIYRASRSGYGCPARVLPLLDLPPGEQPTYTDLLVQAAAKLPAPVRYLELGVSVGKNFYVLAHVLAHALLVGFDWERINPLLAQRFVRVDGDVPLTHYRCGGNRLAYLQGDIADAGAWARLAGMRFNLVFSDACHQPDMLRREYAMLERYQLLDREFVMVWDDLDRAETGAVTQAFLGISERLRARGGIGPAGCFRLSLNGWLGQHEHRHTVGVVNAIGLTAADCA